MRFCHFKHTLYLFIIYTVLAVSCTKAYKKVESTLSVDDVSESVNTRYTQQAAMNIYGYQPIKALQIVDSAVVVGNMSEVRANIVRSRIYSYCQMPNQVDSLLGGTKDIRFDSAKAIGERLLCHDSIKANMLNQLDVLGILIYTARMQNDTTKWIQRSLEYIDICHQLGESHETCALRAEAELGAALHHVGEHELGMAKLDSVINVLETSFLREEDRGTFDELDALIVALKRKIGVLGSHDLYVETLPLARRINELLDDYEQHPDVYHDGSYHEPTSDQKRADYIRFYRSQAQNFITAAYASLGEHGNMLEAFEKIERGVHDAMAREHIARYNALQQQMVAERQKAKANRFILMAIGIGILALLFFVIMVIVSVKNRAINRRNRLLARKIADAIYYKKKYFEEMRLQEPPTAPEIETATDEQLFHYIHEIIIRERLFLDPKFERQTIMDRFQLTKERVGAIFSKGSNYAKLNSYIQHLRLECSAKILVEQPDKNIVQIATDSGFSSSTYFCNCFRQHFGMSPSDYRRDALLQKDDIITL